MKISYGLTVCNEHQELENLILFLGKYPKCVDEIVVVYDQNRVTEQVIKVLDTYKDKISAYPFDFKENFLENKNYMNSKCTGDYIFQIDADEIPNEYLVQVLKPILEQNPIDLLVTPRKNLVEGLTPEHIKKWRWIVSEEGWVNWPDNQKRIYKNDPGIQWTGHQVHGMVTGYDKFAVLPLQEKYSITHNKTIDRQESQNNRYAKIQEQINNQ
jgi:hypothetical protein